MMILFAIPNMGDQYRVAHLLKTFRIFYTYLDFQQVVLDTGPTTKVKMNVIRQVKRGGGHPSGNRPFTVNTQQKPRGRGRGASDFDLSK